MRTRRTNPDSVAVLSRSQVFLLVLSAIVMLGGVLLLRAWHENRNDLLAKEIVKLKRQVRNLQKELIEWRAREARATSLSAIKEKVKKFNLGLHPPSSHQADQILVVQEPDWNSLAQSQGTPKVLSSSRPSGPLPSPVAARSRRTGLWVGDAREGPQPSSLP
jgi:hypothetical protein